jgi:hypothetical protein
MSWLPGVKHDGKTSENTTVVETTENGRFLVFKAKRLTILCNQNAGQIKLDELL